MDKPSNMSVKDYLMRIMSIRANIPLKTIEAVVDHQFTEAHKALDKNFSIELSGFCKFIYNTKKAEKKLERLLIKEKEYMDIINDPNTSENKVKSVSHKLEIARQIIDQIKTKLDGRKPIDGGMEE